MNSHMDIYIDNKTKYINLSMIQKGSGKKSDEASKASKAQVLDSHYNDKTNNTPHIIHISGFPGSGKSTIGNKLQSMFKNKVMVYDTDNFIQHHTKEGKQLLAIEKAIGAKTKTPKDYKVLWRQIIINKINEIILNHKDKIIIFVGSLDNFSWKGEIYDIHIKHKILLDIKLDELMKRYYLRLSDRDAKGDTNDYNSSNYWKNVANGTYNIYGSEQIIKDHAKYNKWHKKHNYKFMNEIEIKGYVKKLLNKQ